MGKAGIRTMVLPTPAASGQRTAGPRQLQRNSNRRRARGSMNHPGIPVIRGGWEGVLFAFPEICPHGYASVHLSPDFFLSTTFCERSPGNNSVPRTLFTPCYGCDSFVVLVSAAQLYSLINLHLYVTYAVVRGRIR